MVHRVPECPLHRFGGMWDESNNKGGMRDKNISAGVGFAQFHIGMRDSLKIDGGMP